MATYIVRGNAHNIVYPYKTEEGDDKQQWETYGSKLEALQRKAYIDDLQEKKMYTALFVAATEYKRQRAEQQSAKRKKSDTPAVSKPSSQDNTDKTCREFFEKWLPFITRKKRFSPNTYDSYRSNLDNHIIPYFGNQIMSTITAENIDQFLDYLSKKPCGGAKSFSRDPSEIPKLASGTVKKCYTVLMSGFTTAKKWRYVKEIPETIAPAERNKKRKAWSSSQVYSVMQTIDNKVLHLAVHLAFVCSLRAGETVGIGIDSIDFQDKSFWVKRQIQRISDEALEQIAKDEIIYYVFPKQQQKSKSCLVLKGPKTEESYRKQYPTTPLLQEIQERLLQIQKNKEYFGAEYHDYGLLICHPDGHPFEPKFLDKIFKKHQTSIGIKEEDQIEFQGLRKSGQMHKVRLTKNNYQLVAENSGQSPEVLMSNYNEALESEKRTLSLLIESNFYPEETLKQSQLSPDVENVLEAIQQNPELTKQVLQLLLLNATHAQ